MTAILMTVLLAAQPPDAQPAQPRTASVRELAPVGLAAPGQATTLSPGRFRALYIEGAAGPVVWEVTPSDVAARVTLNDVLPAGTPIYGQIEGTDAPKLHKFPPASSDVLFIAGVGDERVAYTVNVQAWGVENGKPKKLADLLVSVSPKTPVVPGPTPTPPGPVPPTPTPPQPPPGPVVKAEAVWFAVVDRPTQRAVKYVTLLDDRAFLNTLEALPGVKDFRFYSADAANPDAVAKSFVDRGRKVAADAGALGENGKWTAPVLIAVDKAGTVLLQQLLADTRDGLTAQVKSVLK